MSGAAWAAIGKAAADLGSTAWSISEARQESQRQRDWQEMLSNTAYQRAVADLKAAGLNPILAAQKGGASTPGGGISSMPKADLGGFVSTAIEAKRAKAEIDQKKTDTEIKKQDLKMAKNAMKYYDENPDKRQALHEAILAKKSGIPGWMGAFSGLWRQGKEGAAAWSAKVMDQLRKNRANIKEMEKKKRNKPSVHLSPWDHPKVKKRKSE